MSQQLMRRAAYCSIAAAAAAHSLHSTDSKVEAQEIQDVARIVFQPEDVTVRPLLRVSSDPNLNAGLIRMGAKLASNPKIQKLVHEELEGWMLVEAPGGAAFPVLRETAQPTPLPALPAPSTSDAERKEEVDAIRSLPLSSSAPSALSSLAGPAAGVEGAEAGEEVEVVTPRPEEDEEEGGVVAAVGPQVPATGFAGLMEWLHAKIDGIVELFRSLTSPAAQLPAPAAAALSDGGSAMQPSSSSSASPAAPSSSASPVPGGSAIVSAAVGLAGLLLMLVAVRRFDSKLFTQLLSRAL